MTDREGHGSLQHRHRRVAADHPWGPTHGLITVAREDGSFGEDDLELLRSLASRATLALEDVNLHFDVKRQAMTDD